MKSKELKIYNLPEGRTILSSIDAKPSVLIFVLFIFGILLFVLKQYVWGASLTLTALLMMGLLPRRVLIEFYNSYLVLYNHANKNLCEIIYYEDVEKWSYSVGLSYDNLSITLVDGSVHSIVAFSKITFEQLMNKFLKDKKEKSKKTRKQGV